ncbi:MAG TPA: GTP-binding protein [Clostridia bacterium]|nr:GTP-binding protein [Clostridia bacterium]
MTENSNEHMNIVIVGHVDHGKSTVIGRLLADTGSLPEGKLEQIKELCRRTSKPFEYAFLLDALKDERSQGITIDTARSFFKTDKRKYIIIDAPGHIEFLKNMITGASRADAALLVIDAAEGVKENSRRHGYMLSMLGIKQVCVLVNKMDNVSYSEKAYSKIVSEYDDFLKQIGIAAEGFIPVSAMQGDNIAKISINMPWYKGDTVLTMLDKFRATKPLDSLPFRMPVQDVYKFTADNDDRRIIAGTVESGIFKQGDEVVFYPSGKKTHVKKIEPMSEQEEVGKASAGYATGFTMTEQIYVRRGELCVKADELPPLMGKHMKVSLFWLGKNPMVKDKKYYLKTGTMKAECYLEEILSVMDASTLVKTEKQYIDRHDVADCIISTSRLCAFDNVAALASTGRFVIVDDYEISGGGIFTDTVENLHRYERAKVMLREGKWEHGYVTVEERSDKHDQNPALIILTGAKDTNKKLFAKALERTLFDEGRNVYYLGIGSVIYGLSADINPPGEKESRSGENIRRLAEVANILTDTGLILIVTASDLTKYDIETINLVTKNDNMLVIWLGEECTTDIECDMVLRADEDALEIIRKRVEQITAR